MDLSNHLSHIDESRRHLRIVIVEDNDDAREMMTLLLQLQGHEVATASDGHDGARLICEHRPHLALVDLGLPGLTGCEVALEVRKAGHDGVYLAALTGYGRDEDRQAVAQAGFDEHIVKPLRPEHLQQLIATVASRGYVSVRAS